MAGNHRAKAFHRLLIVAAMLLISGGCKPRGNASTKPSESPEDSPPPTAVEQRTESDPVRQDTTQEAHRFVQLHRRARAAFDTGDFAGAASAGMAALEEALQRDARPEILARAQMTLGEVYLSTGNFDLALTHLEEGRRHSLGGEFSHLSTRLDLLSARAEMNRDGFAEASRLVEAAKTKGETVADTVLRAEVALVAGRLAYLQGDLTGADEQVSLARRLLAEDGQKRTRVYSRALLFAGLLAGAGGDGAVANGLAKEGLSLVSELLGRSHPEVAEAQIQVATIALSQGRFDAAGELALSARTILEETVGAGHPLLVPVLNIEAAVAYSRDDTNGVEDKYRRALTIYEEAYGESYSGLATYLNNLGMLLTSQERYAEAVPLFSRALTIDEQTLGPNHIHLATTLSNLAILADSTGEEGRAEALYTRALKIQRAHYPGPHSETATTLASLATLYAGQERYETALATYREALDMLNRLSDLPDANRGMVTLGLADVYSMVDKEAEAEAAYRKALDELAGALGPNHPYVALVHSAMAEFYDSLDRVEEAQEHLRLANAIVGGSAPAEDADED